MMAPQGVLEKLSKIVGPKAIYVMGVEQHQMRTAQFISHGESCHFLSSCGRGTMGYCVPVAMDAKVAQPDTVVRVIDGDGSFQMTNQESATCSINKVPIKVCLISNSVLGMVRQQQNLFYGQRYSYTTLDPDKGEQTPNLKVLATVHGMAARIVRFIDEVSEAIEWMISTNDRPVLTDFRASKESTVWPTVAAGISNGEIRHTWGMVPDWDPED